MPNERHEEIVQQVRDMGLAPLARVPELERLKERETDAETRRLIDHTIKYTIQEQVEIDFATHLEQVHKHARRKTPFTPEEVSRLKDEFINK